MPRVEKGLSAIRMEGVRPTLLRNGPSARFSISRGQQILLIKFPISCRVSRCRTL
jgi:hypothetical protein